MAAIPSHHDKNAAKGTTTRPPPPPQPPSLVTPCEDSSRPTQQQQEEEESNRKRKRSESGKRVVCYTPKEIRTVETSFIRFKHIGEGTYGSVFATTDKKNSRQVVLKGIKSNIHEATTAAFGFPLTAIREIKLLQAMNHSNILKLNEIVTSKGDNQKRQDFETTFMVFDYAEYDLVGMLGMPQIASRLTGQHCKSWAKQLLGACHYMHTNRILHRDIKPANIFICKDGTLKIGDFGLARSYTPGQHLTGLVVTLWYRAPEVLMGCSTYDSKIDLWSVGCVLAELFYYTDPLFGATDDDQQRQLVFGTCGLPRTSSWPQVEQEWPLYRSFRLANPKFAAMANALPRRLERLKAEQEVFRGQTKSGHKWDIELLVHLLEVNPNKRWSAKDALLSDYFIEEPIEATPQHLNMKFGLNHAHDLDVRKLGRKNQRQERTEAKKAQREMQFISSKWLSVNKKRKR